MVEFKCAKTGKYNEGNIGYCEFMRIRLRIAELYKTETGSTWPDLYVQIPVCFRNEDWMRNLEKQGHRMIRKGQLDRWFYDLMMSSDCDGSVPFRTCQKLWDLIGNNEEINPNFKQIVYECVANRSRLIWY